MKLSFGDYRLHGTTGFYTLLVHIIASERVKGTGWRFRTQRPERTIAPAPAIACLCSSPAISHLAGEPDPALLVPTDNWTNRSHSLRANYSSLFLSTVLPSFLPSFSYPCSPCPRRSFFSASSSLSFFSFLSDSLERYFSRHLCTMHAVSSRLRDTFLPPSSFPFPYSLFYFLFTSFFQNGRFHEILPRTSICSKSLFGTTSGQPSTIVKKGRICIINDIIHILRDYNFWN